MKASGQKWQEGGAVALTVNSILPEGKQIRIRSFYGFGPEEDGYVGWTQESSRDAYLRKLNDGDLIMIVTAPLAPPA